MSFINIDHKYYSQADDPNGSGGAGGTHITAEVQAIIDNQVNEWVTGLKAKNSELPGNLKEQSDNLKRFENDEEAKLITAGKIDEVINKRTEQLRHWCR